MGAKSGLVSFVLPDVRHTTKNGSIPYPRPKVILANYVQKLSIRLQFAYLDKVVLRRS